MRCCRHPEGRAGLEAVVAGVGVDEHGGAAGDKPRPTDDIGGQGGAVEAVYLGVGEVGDNRGGKKWAKIVNSRYKSIVDIEFRWLSVPSHCPNVIVNDCAICKR